MANCETEECFKTAYDDLCFEYSKGVEAFKFGQWDIPMVASIVLLTALGIFLLVSAKF